MSQLESHADHPHLRAVAATPLNTEKQIWLPVLDKVDPHLVSMLAPESPEAEQYRALRYAVEQIPGTREGTVVGVCSPTPGDGKTLTSINIAGALAQNTQARVLLIEVDLRRPAVTISDHLALGDIAGHGLVDAILDSNVLFEDVIRRIPIFNLSVLAAGRHAVAPYEMLKSPRFNELLTLARRQYDYVVLDAPPVIPVPDCRLIAKWVDGFIMVLRAHRTPREALEEALTILEGANILGLVFNGHDRLATRYYGYGYGYGNAERARNSWWARLWSR
jgi:capsular exopolysaccharide synthesis family protein